MAGFNLTAQLNLRGPSNVKQIVSDIQKQLGTITGNVNLNINPSTTRNVTQLNAALTTLNSNLSQVQNNANNAARAISAFANSANTINRATNTTTRQIDTLSNATTKLNQSQKTTQKQLAASTTQMQEFGKQSALAVRRFAAFSGATGVIVGFASAIRSGVSAFIDYEKEFVKVQQVTDKTAEQLKGLNYEVTRLSTSLGVASSELISVSSTLAQAGLTAAETQKALQALALTDLSPSFSSLNDTVEGSIALMRQFGISAKELERSLGSVNAVAAAFAVESGDLIAAIQRTGGVFAAASKGVSEGTQALNEFLAVFTSVRQTTRESAETIATGLRTIFTRIQREDTIEALREYGVNLTDVEGKFVGAYKAVELLSKGLSGLDPRDIRFSNIVEELGGFRQIGKVIPLIQQFSVAQQALFVAQKGQGSLAKDAAIAQLSLANQISKVREEFLALMRTIGSSDMFQGITRRALGFASTLIKIIDTVKGALPVLAIIGAGKLASGIGQYATGFVKNIGKSTEDQSGPPKPLFATRSSNTSTNTSGTRDLSLLDDLLRQNTQAVNGLAGNVGGLSSNMDALNISINNLSTSLNSISQFAQNIQNNTTSLNDLTANIINLNNTIQNTSFGGGGGGSSGGGGGPSGGAPPYNNGGKVLRFARGGIVPGVGNSDTVSAMLQPGEFVIRKKAVETIGADRLQQINKYSSGGSVRSGSSDKRQKFEKGGPILVKTAASVPGGRGKEGIASYYNDRLQERDKIVGNIDRKTIGKQQVETFYDKIGSPIDSSLEGHKKFATDMREASTLDISKSRGKSTGKSSDARYKLPFNFSKGFAFEDFMGAYLEQVENKKGYNKSSGQYDPLDFEGPGDPIEARFRNEKTPDSTILAKRLRYSLLKQGLPIGFTKNIDDKPPVDIGGTTVYEIDPAYKKALRLKLGGKVQKFIDGGETKKIKAVFDWQDAMKEATPAELGTAISQIDYWISQITKGKSKTGWAPTFDKKTRSEEVDLNELIGRKYDINEYLEKLQSYEQKRKLNSKSALKGAAGYEPEELLDAVKLYQGGSGPLTRAMVNNDLLFVDRDEQYDTEDVVNRLKAASQYSTGRKKLYSGIGRGQFYEILRDVGIDQKDYIENGINDKAVKQMVGKTIDFPTFVSTSYDKSVAEAFIGNPGGLMDISTVKSRIKGIDIDKAKATKDPGKRRKGKELPGIDKIKKAKLLAYDDEKEFVLPPNTQFKIKKAVNQQIIGTNDQGEQFTLEDYDYFGIDPEEDDGTLELPSFMANRRRDRVVDLSVQMLGQGGTAGSLTGIYDSDKIEGGTKVKKALLDQLRASGKAYEVIHGPAGSGKTTLASQRYGENFVLSPEDLAKYQRFVVLSGAGTTKSGEFSEDVQSLMSGASGITALMPGEERLAAQRQKRVDEAILGNIRDTRSVSQLQGTLRAPANVSRSLFEKFKGVNYLEEYAVGGEVERLAAKFNLGKASRGWWRGKFRDQDILWDMANRRTAYNAEDGSAIDISSLPASLKKTWDYQAQTELDEYRKYKSMVRGAAQTPKTKAEEEYNKAIESSVMSATQRIAEKKKQEEIAKLAARGGRFTGDYEPTRARQQSKIDSMTPDERKQYYARKLNRYMEGSTVTDEQSSSYLDRLIQDIAELGGPKEVRKLAGIPVGDLRARKALNANSIKANKDTAYVESLIRKARKASQDEQERAANDIERANKFALVGIYPIGYKKSFGPKDIGGKSTFYTAAALGTEYQPEIDEIRSKIAESSPSDAMKRVQMKKIFSSRPLALDLDDTLITGADIYKPGSAGDPDIPAYSDVDRVTEALQNARLTQLGEELKTRLNDDPSLLDDIRILTARPQNNADAISQRLQQLGVGIPAEKITGVSGASNKVNNLTELETLIDDRLATVSEVLGRGKKAFGYTEIQGYNPNRVASKRNAQLIEAYVAEEMLTRIGIDLPEDAESNRSIDFPNGLGAAASIWGIDPFVPTDFKRTMSSTPFDRFREEIERFYQENPDKYAMGGVVGSKLLDKYKGVLARVLPESMLSEEGFFKGTSAENIQISEKRNLGDWARYFLGQPGATYVSDYKSYVRQALLDSKDQIDPKDYGALEKELLVRSDANKTRKSRIFAPKGYGYKNQDDAIAHEAIHDIQFNLRESQPELYRSLTQAAVSKKAQVVDLMEKHSKLIGYKPDDLFGSDPSDLAYSGFGSFLLQKATKSNVSTRTQETLAGKIEQYKRQDEILAILMQLSSSGVNDADSLLNDILESSGIKRQKFFDGGSVQGLSLQRAPIKLNMGGVASKSKRQTPIFGTGEFPFPRRISNAYFREIEKTLEAQRIKDVWDRKPKDERIIPDADAVQAEYDKPFDKGMFLTSFKDRISKDTLFQRMGQFAKFIGLPNEDLSAVLPQQIDFGAPGMLGGALFSADPTGYRTRGLEKVDLTQYGFTEQDQQDVFGYGKLLEEKEKAVKKVLKTPVRTFEDGSFSYDYDAAKALWSEINDLKTKISEKAKIQRYASDKAKAARMQIAETTGRGGISIDSDGFSGNTQRYDVLYHELTHQLFQSMRVRNAESFDKYKDRVNALFEGDNDDLANAFDSLTEYGYKSADVVYGRSYKQKTLEGMALNIYRRAKDSNTEEDKNFATDIAKGITNSQKSTRATDFKPINPFINSLLLKGQVDQEAINKMEDNGKEEFLTTLIQNAPKLDSNLNNVLENTLTSLLNDAGIQRQKFAIGGSVEDTVPALLTPGEFVINKNAAQKIGYAKLNKLNQADKIQGYNKGGIVQHFASGGKASPGDYEAGVQKIQMEFEALAKSVAQTTYAMQRSAGATAMEAKTRANHAGIVAVQQEAIKRLWTATGDAAQQIHDATRNFETDRQTATTGAYTPPSGKDMAAIRATEAMEYFALQAKYFGISIKEYTNSLKKNIIETSLQQFQNTPKNIDQFKLRANELRSTLQLSDTGPDAERVTDARDELASLLKDITGIYDDTKINSAIQNLESNLDNTSLTFLQAINNSKLLSDMFRDASDKGNQYQRVLKEMSDATGVAVEELEKVVSLDDVLRIETNKKLAESTQKLASNISKAGVYIATFGGIVSKFLDAPNERSARGTASAIGSGTETAGSLLAFGGNILSTTAATAAMTGGGALSSAAASLMPILTNPITLAVGGVVVALGGLASATKEYSNAVREFDIEQKGKEVDKGLERVANYFKNFAQDLQNLNLLDSIKRELTVASSNIIDRLNIQAEVPKVFWVNFFDALAVGDAASAERSRILETRGTGAYLQSTAFGQNVGGAAAMTGNALLLGIPDLIYGAVSSAITGRAFSDSSFFTDVGLTGSANRARNVYTQVDAPEIAAQSSQAILPIAESINKLFEENIRSGATFASIIEQLGSSTAPSRFAEVIARSNPVIEEQIIRIKANNLLSKEEQQARINAIIALEAEYKTRLLTESVLKQIEFKKLADATRVFVTSIQRILNGMNNAIGRTTYEIEKLSTAANLSNEALSGSAQAGQIFIKGINVLQNRSAYSPVDNDVAATQAANMFGPASEVIRSLLNIGDVFEETVLSTINDTIRNSATSASPEKIAGAVRAALNQQLNNLGLPPDLSEKLSRATQRAFSELRTGDNKKLSFSELAEKVPQFAQSIDVAKEAQQAAIQALEFWQTRVNDYAKAMNQAMEYQFEANEKLRNSSLLRIKSEEDLDRALGKIVDLASQRDRLSTQTRLLTGGTTNPNDIKGRILELENIRTSQQSLLEQASQAGPENQDAIRIMTRNLNFTNLALKENYKALNDMADSADLAGAAISKIGELQRKNQAAQTLIEKAVTSNASEMLKFNRSLSLLNNNMAGRLNPGSTPEQRSDVLQVFSLIAPLLGERQNELKANVFESLLLESGVGINGLFRDVITSLRNPEADPVMAEAISIYKDGVRQQIAANDALREIKALMSENTAQAAADALAKVINAPENLQIQILTDIKLGINDLVRLAGGNQPQAKASGGMIYANNGMFVNFQPKGTDTVPAMLTPGEFVVNRTATQKNLPLLKSINSGNTSYYARGGIVLGGNWRKDDFDTLEENRRVNNADPDQKQTAQSFVQLKELDTTKIITSPEQTIQKAPNSFYAVGKGGGPVGDPIRNTEYSTIQKALDKDQITAAPGVSYDSARIDLGMLGYAPAITPTNPVASALANIKDIGTIPDLIALESIVDYISMPQAPVKKAEVEKYRKAYITLMAKLKDAGTIYNEYQNIPKDDTLNVQVARAEEAIKSKIEVTGTSGFFRSPLTLKNLTYSPGGDNKELLFLKNVSSFIPGNDVGNILGFRWDFYGNPTISAGIANMRPSTGSVLGDNTLSYANWQQGIILDNLSKLNSLETMIKTSYDALKAGDLSMVDDDQSLIRKSLIAKLNSFYDEKVFSINLGSEILKDRSAEGIDLPLTLYNIQQDKWNNYIQSLDKTLADKQYAKDNFIDIFPVDDNGIVNGNRRSIPWTSKSGARLDKDLLERFGKEYNADASRKPIRVRNKTYGKVGPGNSLHIPYKEVEGRVFNPLLGRFDPESWKYVLIDPTEQDATYNPGSPLGEIIPQTRMVLAKDIQSVVEHIKDRTPSYDPNTGEPIPAKVVPPYLYGLHLLPNKDANLTRLLGENAEYTTHSDIQKYVAWKSNNPKILDGDLYNILSDSYKKAVEKRNEQQQKELKKKIAGRTADADMFDLKTTLTPADKARGLGEDDLESLSAEKRVTFARYFYDKYAKSMGIKSAKPTNLQGVQSIVSDLGMKLSDISLKEGGIGGEKYNDVYALRNIFGTLFKLKDGDINYIKRLGFPLKNKDFVGRVPKAADPANPDRTPIDYYEKLNPNIDGLMELLFNRERDYARAVGNLGGPNRTPFPEKLRDRIQNDVDGFSLTEINKSGEISDSKEKAKIQQWTDVERIALNPYNIPSQSSARQRLLDDLYYFYRNDKDAKGKNIWPKERSDFIGTAGIYDDRKILKTKDILAGAFPETLREWYSIQDNILNNSKDQSDLEDQSNELAPINKIFDNQLRTADIQEKHKYLTGNLYGGLPDSNYLLNKLATQNEARQKEQEQANLSRGGVVYASTGKYINFEPRGTDTVPAMLTPGEFVVNRAATQKNLPLLQAINRNNGGLTPKVYDGVTYASVGGSIIDAVPYFVQSVNESYKGLTGDEESSPVSFKKAVGYLLKSAVSAGTSTEAEAALKSIFGTAGGSEKVAKIKMGSGSYGQIASFVAAGANLVNAIVKIQHGLHELGHDENGKGFGNLGKGVAYIFKAINEFKSTDFVKKILGNNPTKYIFGASALINAADSFNYSPEETGVSQLSGALYASILENPKAELKLLDAWSEIASGSYNLTKMGVPYPYALISAAVVENVKQIEALYRQIQDLNVEALSQRSRNVQGALTIGQRSGSHIPLHTPVNKIGIKDAKLSGLAGFYEWFGSAISSPFFDSNDLTLQEIYDQATRDQQLVPIDYMSSKDRYNYILNKIKPADNKKAMLGYSVMNRFYKDAFGVWPELIFSRNRNRNIPGEIEDMFEGQNYRDLPNNYELQQDVSVPTEKELKDYIRLYNDILQHNRDIKLGVSDNYSSGNAIDLAGNMQDNYINTKQAMIMYNYQAVGKTAETIGKSMEIYKNELLKGLESTKQRKMLMESDTIADYLNDSAAMASGGVVYASTGKHINFAPRGTDVIPAMLSPGEFVVNSKATAQNLPLLQQMNKGGKVIYRRNGSNLPEGTMTYNDESYSGPITVSMGSNGVIVANKTEQDYERMIQDRYTKSYTKPKTSVADPIADPIADDYVLKMQIIDEILRMTKLQAKTKTTYMPIPGVVAPPISVQSTDYTPEEQTNIDVLLKEKDRYQDLLAFHLLGEDGPSWFTRAELLLKQGGEIGVGLGGGMAGGAGATAVSGPAAPVAGPAGAAAGYIGSVWAYRELLGDEYKDRLDKLKAAYPRQSFVTDLAPLLIVAAQARTIVGNIQTIIRESGKRALVGKAFADLTGDIGGSAIASFATGTPYSPNATDAIFSLLGVDPNKRLSLLKQQEEGYNLYGVLRKAANIDGEYAAFDGTLTHAHTTSRIDNVDPTLLPSLMSYAKFRKSVIFTLFNSMDQVPDTIKNAKNPYEALLRYVEQPEIAKAIMSLMKPEVRSPAGILLPNTINQQLKEGIDRKQLIEILDILGTRVFDTTQGRRGNARIIPDDPIKLLDTIKEQIRSGNGPIKDAELGAIFDGLSDQWKIRALGDDFTWTNPPAAQLGYNQLSETQKKLLDLGDEPGKSTYADRAKSNSRTTGTQGRIENAAFELIDGKDGKKWKKVKATSRTPQRRSLRPLYEPRSIGGNIKDMLKDFFGLNGPPPLKTNSVFYKDVVKAAKATKSEDISPKTFSDMFFGAVRGEPHEIATNVSNFAKLFGLPVSNVVPKGLEIFANKALSGVKDAFGWWREGTGQMFVMENSPFGMATLMHELVHSMVHRFGKSAYSNLQSVIKTKMPKIIEYMKKNPSLYGSYGTKDIAGGMYYVINKLLGTRIDKESMMAQLSGPLNPVDIGNLDLETATQLPIDFELSNGIVVPTYLTNALNLKRPPPLPLMLNDQGIKYYDDVGKLMDMYDADTMNLEDIKKQYTSLYVSQLDPLEFADFPDGATLMKNALADIEKNTSAEFDNYVNWGREEFITQTIQNLPRLDANGLELLSEILSEGLVQNGSAVFEKNVLYDRLRRYINEYRDSADSNPNVSQEIKDYYRTGEQLPPSLPQTRARGGMIYASNGSLIDFSPRGTDTVPAMLTPGEFVINKAATSKHLPLLRSINRGETIYRQKGSDEPEGMSGPTIAQRQAEKRMYQLMEMPRHGHTLTEIEQQELAKLRADYAKRPDVIAKRQSRSDELAVDRILRKRKADRTPEENQILDRWNKEMDAKVPNRAYRRNPQNRGKEGKTIYYNVGGSVNFQSIGTDVIPAMLTPGEFVVNREATKKNYSLLKQINDGSYYSRGDIVKKFNLGGYVKPSYLRTGGEPSLSGILPQNNSFDFASFMQQLIGQLSTIVSSSIRDIANSNQQNNTRDIDNRSNGVSINIESQVLDRISDFTNRLRSVADTLAGLSAIPSDIRITAKHDINIVINGDSVLNRLNPEIQSIVMQELRRGFQNLIDLNSPVASDKLNNPFDIA